MAEPAFLTLKSALFVGKPFPLQHYMRIFNYGLNKGQHQKLQNRVSVVYHLTYIFGIRLQILIIQL